MFSVGSVKKMNVNACFRRINIFSRPRFDGGDTKQLKPSTTDSFSMPNRGKYKKKRTENDIFCSYSPYVGPIGFFYRAIFFISAKKSGFDQDLEKL